MRLFMLGGGGGGPWFAVADNPVAHDHSILTRFYTFLYLPVFNFLLVLWPWQLSFDWSMDAIAPVKSLMTDARNLLSIIFYTAILALGMKALKKQRQRPGVGGVGNPLLILSMALLIVPFIPASNLFFYVGFVVAERVLYLPSAGYCVLLAIGLDRLILTFDQWQCQQRRKFCKWLLQVWILLTITGFWSLRTIQRNADWMSEERLYRSAIGINPAKGQFLFFYSFYSYSISFGMRMRCQNNNNKTIEKSQEPSQRDF